MTKLLCAGSGSSGNAYAIETEKEILLLECGVNWKKILKMISFHPKKVVGCLATHAHIDHMSAYKDVLMNGIPIYTNDETVEHFEVVTGEKMIGRPDSVPFDVGSFRITPFYVPHDGTKNFAYLVGIPDGGLMLYATDFEYLPFSFRSFRINYFLLECNHMDDLTDRDSAKYEHVLRGHSSLSTVKKIIEVNKTFSMRNIILCHLSADNADPNQMQKEIQEIAGKRTSVDIAKLGLNLDLQLYPF